MEVLVKVSKCELLSYTLPNILFYIKNSKMLLFFDIFNNQPNLLCNYQKVILFILVLNQEIRQRNMW